MQKDCAEEPGDDKFEVLGELLDLFGSRPLQRLIHHEEGQEELDAEEEQGPADHAFARRNKSVSHVLNFPYFVRLMVVAIVNKSFQLILR